MGKRLYAKAAILACLLTTGCATTTATGDAGCIAYGEARLSLPNKIPDTFLGGWVADLDDRMTGVCR